MEHEYSVLGGFNRAAIGRYLSIGASVIASGMGVLVAYLLDLAKRWGWADHVPGLVLWPLTAGLIYTALYWWFESRIWKHPQLAAILKVPYLAGHWKCVGQTLGGPHAGTEWNGEVVIVQSWDKIRVRLSTRNSGSNSIAAALLYDHADGYRLLYNYKNDPNIDHPELGGHRGCAELLFGKDLNSATGEYFNGYGRYTFGTLTLTRG